MTTCPIDYNAIIAFLLYIKPGTMYLAWYSPRNRLNYFFYRMRETDTTFYGVLKPTPVSKPGAPPRTKSIQATRY